ncbi:MAG: YihY/virulence factor BrkB family protein, partial [Acidobacteriaceae bacterium]|nr:YihY/virulence factor BrkB family protein [Acidobacteriaceae bacterium]
DMWTLGGLRVRELVRRTWAESWQDAAFGQAGRMAFYHFLAIFPSLLIFLTLASRVPLAGPNLRSTIVGVSNEFLPEQASWLMQEMTSELDRRLPLGFQFVTVCAGALWAALNGTWALVSGLNIAYEVEERRPWWKVGITIVGLTVALAFAGSVAFVLLFAGTAIEQRLFHQHLSFYAAAAGVRALEWAIVIGLLTFSFAVVYRFAPNLRDHRWMWSTPGAACALLLWIIATLCIRFYFEHVNNYALSYGHLNSAVMLMLWLYLTNGAILIGGEMNSEIEKAAEHRQTEHDRDSQRVNARSGS